MAGRGSASSAAGSSAAATCGEGKGEVPSWFFALQWSSDALHDDRSRHASAVTPSSKGDRTGGTAARISGLQLAEEQRSLAEDGHVHTFPDQQFPWVPRPKAKAKTAPHVPTMEFVGDATVPGAMTDASKRRFIEEEDPDYQTALDEFELVQAMNEFNSGGGLPVGPAIAAGLGPYGRGEMDEIPMAESEQVVVTTTTGGAPTAPTAHDNRMMTHYAVQGDNALPPDEDTSWYPEVNQEIQDALVSVPATMRSPIEWGTTVCRMPKFRERRWTYEQMLRMSLGGHGEVAAYLSFFLDRYAAVYRQYGSKTQAADLAGYLMRYRVRILKTVPPEGFARELA